MLPGKSLFLIEIVCAKLHDGHVASKFTDCGGVIDFLGYFILLGIERVLVFKFLYLVSTTRLLFNQKMIKMFYQRVLDISFLHGG